MDKKKISLKEIGLPKLIMIFVAGIIIILLSFPGIFGSKKSTDDSTQSVNTEVQQNVTNTTSYDTNTYITEMENKLESILRKVSGIGEVEVMLTLKASQEKVPLKDNPSTQESLIEDDGEGGSRTNNSVKREESTVLVTNEDGNSMPYILQELEPEIEGVVVIAEGGDDVNIKMDIMEAAEVLFDVPAHKVKVMKMSNGIK
jgi:stage III sporulation protein AG